MRNDSDLAVGPDAPGPDTSGPDAPGAGATPTLHDRRRPGRIHIANPHLIALLRSTGPRAAQAAARIVPEPAGPDLEIPFHIRDDLDPVRGLALSAVLGLVLWLGLIELAHMVWKQWIA